MHRLVWLMARLVRGRHVSVRDAAPIDPALLPLDLASWRAPL